MRGMQFRSDAHFGAGKWVVVMANRTKHDGTKVQGIALRSQENGLTKG